MRIDSVQSLVASERDKREDERPPIRIGELGRRVGVRPETLRAWERRYGLLAPERSTSGYRLYSSRDEERVRELRSRRVIA